MKSSTGVNNQVMTNAPSTGTAIRFIGIAITLFGLAIGFQVVQSAWGLFDDQQMVITLTEKVNEHSNLDKSLHHFLQEGQMQSILNEVVVKTQAGELDTPPPDPVPQHDSAEEPPELRASYFVAWALTLLLLGLIARIAIWAITAGGKMALYGKEQNQELKKLLQEVIIESRVSSAREQA